MDNKKISKEALAELEKEKATKIKEEFKQYFSNTLQELEVQKKNKEIAEEKIRILNKDLDDLKAGDLDKIKERQEKSELAKHTSQVKITKVKVVQVLHSEPDWWRGTYPVTTPVWTCTTGSSTTNNDLVITANGSNKVFYF